MSTKHRQKSSGHGGARRGAGRPSGSTDRDVDTTAVNVSTWQALGERGASHRVARAEAPPNATEDVLDSNKKRVEKAVERRKKEWEEFEPRLEEYVDARRRGDEEKAQELAGELRHPGHSTPHAGSIGGFAHPAWPPAVQSPHPPPCMCGAITGPHRHCDYCGCLYPDIGPHYALDERARPFAEAWTHDGWCYQRWRDARYWLIVRAAGGGIPGSDYKLVDAYLRAVCTD